MKSSHNIWMSYKWIFHLRVVLEPIRVCLNRPRTPTEHLPSCIKCKKKSVCSPEIFHISLNAFPFPFCCMVTGWLKHTVIILSSSAVSDLCSLMQFVLSSSEEHGALSGNIQKSLSKRAGLSSSDGWRRARDEEDNLKQCNKTASSVIAA